jgi:hypothetical protein
MDLPNKEAQEIWKETVKLIPELKNVIWEKPTEQDGLPYGEYMSKFAEHEGSLTDSNFYICYNSDSAKQLTESDYLFKFGKRKKPLKPGFLIIVEGYPNNPWSKSSDQLTDPHILARQIKSTLKLYETFDSWFWSFTDY